ncbi:hypothetical protein HMPREF0973_00111 [Prevotella veroralis F0319]|uniref:Uncharacterized protein n=2 Tax=Prevotella veroralis TaxID=28137 RepID=C9MKK3_9BACT|nr:hypothetical protein HMPREF0973_00111 [Prevotella veroralis F0319]
MEIIALYNINILFTKNQKRMKKTFLTFVLLFTAVALQAQTLIKANFNKGDKATYEYTANIDLASMMQGKTLTANVTSKLHVDVKEANAEGYQIELLFSDLKVDGDETALQQGGGQLLTMLNDVPLLYQTDKNGALKKLLNSEEAVGKMSKTGIAKIDSLYAKNPEIEKVNPKMNMLMALSNTLTEEFITEYVKEQTVFSLYGKTLKTGDQEDKSVQGMKTTTSYDVNQILGMLTIVGKVKANMSEDDVKGFLIGNMKKFGVGDDAVSQIEKNWSQMRAMGMTTITYNATDTYHFTPSFWVNDYTTESRMKLMGMDVKGKGEFKLGEHSWK